nr:3-hydroxy-3-methylglutaryl-CoA reductase [Euryarchaeota archaeon]
MPVDNSRLKGFYKLSVKERRDMIAELAGLDQVAVDALAAMGELSEAAADRISENVVATLALPAGVATNFIVEG